MHRCVSPVAVRWMRVVTLSCAREFLLHTGRRLTISVIGSSSDYRLWSRVKRSVIGIARIMLIRFPTAHSLSTIDGAFRTGVSVHGENVRFEGNPDAADELAAVVWIPERTFSAAYVSCTDICASGKCVIFRKSKQVCSK